MNCEHCQPLLLDHLYGLLDGAEAAGVEAHLASCPACAAARAETARLQGLFARAAKGTFPNARFEPPVAAPAQPVQKAEPRTPTRTSPHTHTGGSGRRVAAVLPWAVAAAVLLAVPGTVVPVLDLFKNAEAADRAAESARREAEAATRAVADARSARENRLSDAQMSLTVAEQARVALLEKWVEEQKATVQVAAAQKLNIDVLKPATVQPGAPNDFLLVVRDERDGSARRSRLVAEVRASDAVLFTQPLDHEKRGNQHPIRLPASVWSKVKPDAELTLVVAEVDEKTQARTTLQEVRLAGPVFTTLLVTDKPAYRPGERLFFRSLTLDRVTLKPPAREQVLRYDLVAGAHPLARPVPGLTATGTTELVRVGDGNGRVEPVRAADGQPVRGVGCGEFVLPADLADGDYTLVLRELPAPGAPAALALPVARTVKVRAEAADHYAKQVGFAAASFVSGDTVEAWTELRFHDRPVAGAEVAGAVVQVDGVPLDGIEATPRTDKDGRARVRFALPRDVMNGDVRLKVTFRAGNREETVADRVPVISRRLKVEFFPEGGDQIVAGVPCKVYVRATTPAGQPVDISGTVTDGRQALATVKTLRDDAERGANRGLASFTFTPRAGTPVWLKLDAPHGVHAPILVDAPVRVAAVALLGGPAAVAQQTGFALPDAQLDGVVMSVPDVVTAPGQPIGVHLYSVGQPRTLVVGAYVRGRLADTQKVRAEPGQLAEVKLMAGADPRGGVVRVTAFEEVDAKNDPERTDLKPVAERLVFRRAGEVLNLALRVAPTEALTAATPQAPQVPGRAAYPAGTPLGCAVTATDEKNNPTAAVLWAAVVNTGVAPGARDRTLPTHFLLAGDVKDPDGLEYADFLLTDHPKAREALDLVLGTQGWRRFAEQARLPLAGNRPPVAANNAAYYNLAAGPDLARLMVQNGQYAVAAEPAAVRDARKVGETYSPLYEAAVQAVARARAALDATRTTARDGTEIQQAQEAESAARRAAAEQAARAESARAPVQRFRSAVWFGVAGFAALALLCGGVSLARPQTRLPLGVSTVGSFGLAAFLFVASGWADEARGHERVAAAVPGARAGAKAPTEVAPAPRLVPGPADRAAAPAAGAAVTPTGGPEMKADGFAKGPPGGGFGGLPGGVGAGGGPAGPGGNRPPGGPKELSGTSAKAGFAPGAPPAGAAPGPLAPLPPAPAMKAAGFADTHGETGWVPAKPLGVTAGDLKRSAPSDPHFWSGPLKSLGDDRAVALRKANADAARFAQERQRALAAQVELHYGTRGALRGAQAQPPAPEYPVPLTYNDAPLTPAKVEALALQQVREAVSPLPPLVVREYARPRPAPAPMTEAADAPDTILWQPVVVVPGDGKAVLNFALGSAPGGYRVLVAGHTADGRLGEARTLVAVAPEPTTLPPAQAATGGSIPPKVPTAPAPPPGP